MKYFIVSFLCLFGTLSYGQQLEQSIKLAEEDSIVIQDNDSIEVYKVKRISLGVKLGIPNVAGVSLEGITPFIGNRIAPYFDFSSFPVNTNETDVKLKYSEFGSNFYFGENGKGVYAGIGFGSLNTDITFKEVKFEEDGNRGTGTASLSTKVNTTNFKLGIKTGGRIYFRLEFGYGIGTIPETLEVTGTFSYQDSDGNTQKEIGTETEDFPALPGVTTNGTLVGNFGFGVSF